MIVSLSARQLRAIILDVEGTTTPIDFVHGVLFPYARTQLRSFLQRGLSEDIRHAVQLLRDEYDEDVRSGAGPPEWQANPHSVEKAAIVAYLEWLMDRDRKSPGLKLLQGMIWKDGYRVGSLRGQVFPDVPRALARWREHEMDVRIFSSGSVLAQRLLFETTPSGDLTKLLNGYFDTGTGPKTASASYHRIAAEIDRPPIECLFVSDVVAELDAAQAAGMQTLLSIRPGNAPQAAAHNHGTIRSFDEIVE